MTPVMIVRTALSLVLLVLVSSDILYANGKDGSSNREEQMVDRPDDVDPEEHPTVPLFGRPLTVLGQVETIFEYAKDFALDPAAKDDLFLLDHQELELALFYRLTDTLALYLQGKAAYGSIIYAQDRSQRDFTWQIERDETWLYAANLFGSRFSLQIGRQKFQDKREWWWDQDLDSVRLHYNRPTLHAALAVAQEVAQVSTKEERLDPEDNKVLRVLGHVMWGWAEEQRLEAFFLYHHDHSPRPALGQLVSAVRQDPSDAKLSWFGVRTSGKLKLNEVGEFDYWLDSAGVAGTETLFVFDDNLVRGRSPVSARRQRHVLGWGVDVGASLQARFPQCPTTRKGELLWCPTLTLAYATGSGDRNPERRGDRGFRQTGIQENEARFRGINRFSFYGELLDPELSNLHIWTAALGFRVLPSSSVELLYHAYRQVHAVPGLRSSRIEAEPTGLRRTIGQEWNLVIGVEEWDGIEIQLVGAVFRAGSAYGPFSGRDASSVTLEVNITF